VLGIRDIIVLKCQRISEENLRDYPGSWKLTPDELYIHLKIKKVVRICQLPLQNICT